MIQLLINIDVDDIAAAERFYCAAFQLHVGRRFGDGALELLGAGAKIYLLAKEGGTPATAAGESKRSYARHWTPIHLDLVVDDVEQAVARSIAAGAVQERPVRDNAWGKIAEMRDPFGHGYCLIAFSEAGYDAIASSP